MQENKTYLITGATSGIGKVCALKLLELGNKCIVVGRNQLKLNNIQLAYSDRAIPISADLSEYDSIINLVEQIKNDIKLDGFIHCAGIAPLKRIEENDPKTVLQTYSTQR